MGEHDFKGKKLKGEPMHTARRKSTKLLALTVPAKGEIVIFHMSGHPYVMWRGLKFQLLHYDLDVKIIDRNVIFREGKGLNRPIIDYRPSITAWWTKHGKFPKYKPASSPKYKPAYGKRVVLLRCASLDDVAAIRVYKKRRGRAMVDYQIKCNELKLMILEDHAAFTFCPSRLWDGYLDYDLQTLGIEHGQ